MNRGISGQTTAQMVVRFHQDVVDLHPAVVVILAGTNDVAENTGPMTPRDDAGQLPRDGGDGAGERDQGGGRVDSAGGGFSVAARGWSRRRRFAR